MNTESRNKTVTELVEVPSFDYAELQRNIKVPSIDDVPSLDWVNN